jgi:aryl-alcohol dehydrogenase-like predicted oxidoreductase
MALAMGHTQRQVLKMRRVRDVWYALRALKNHRRDIAAGARFGFLSQRPEMTAAQAALAYVLADPNVSCAVVGTTRLRHLTENLAASGMRLPAEVMDQIRRVQAFGR